MGTISFPPGQEDGGTSSDTAHADANEKAPVAMSVTDAIIALTNEYRTQSKKNESQQRGNDCWVKVGTVAVAIYTVITAFLWSTAQEANKTAARGVETTRYAVEISQRAWLIATQFVEFKSPLTKEDKVIGVPLIIENSGKTPALYVQGWDTLLCTKNPQARLDWLLVTQHMKATEIPQFTIGPGQKIGTVAVNLPLPPGCSMDEILAKQRSLLTAGYLHYWDEFGMPRGLLTCGIYNPDSKRFEFCGHDNLPW